MTYKIQGEQPFQVLASNFSIGPSNEGYTLQISADGRNYSDLFSVGANVTRMVTGVANGSYYRLSGNNSLVTVNWNKQCSDGQGGGGGGSTYILPPATDRTLGGVKVGNGLSVTSDGTLSANGGGGSVDNTILKATSGFPTSSATEWISDITTGFTQFRVPLNATSECYLQGFHMGGDPFTTDLWWHGEDDPKRWDMRGTATDWEIINLNTEFTYTVNTNTITAAIDGDYVVVTLSQPVTEYSQVGGIEIMAETVVPIYPEDLEEGDVYAIHKDATEAVIGSTWTDAGAANPSWNRDYDGSQPQAMRVALPANATYPGMYVGDIQYACNDYDTSQAINISSEGTLSVNTDVFTEVESNHWVLSDAAWVPSKTDGNVIHVVWDGEYLYVYSTDVTKLWLMGMPQNSTGNNVFTGEVTPGTEASNDVYQFTADGGEKLLKAKDIDTNRLLPENPNEGAMPIYNNQDGWVTTNRDAVFVDGLYAFQNNWSDDGQHYTLTRDGYWDVNWTPSYKMVKLTQTEYDNMSSHDGNTLYIIIPD